MSTPNDPQDPYRTPEPQDPAGGQPTGPGTGAPDPAAPQHPAAPQYPGAPAGSPQYPAQPPAAPQYPAPPQYAAGPPAATPYPAAPTYAGEYGAVASPTARNALGTWALVLGILAVLQICALVTGIIAIVLGNRSRQAVARGEASNGTQARWGVVLGIIGLAIWLILVVVVVVNRMGS